MENEVNKNIKNQEVEDIQEEEVEDIQEEEEAEDEGVSCREAIVSEEYGDLIVQHENNITATMIRYNSVCYQIINDKYAILHTLLPEEIIVTELDRNIIPRLFGPYGISSLDASGVLPFHEQPYVPLLGRGVLIGFVDSGIDYTHPTFIYEDNTSKILSIWDQTIQSGQPPLNFQYGTEYTNSEINEAIASDDPFAIVPSVDETGHGTFLAGAAAGRFVPEANFKGAAPEADIIMVKLKPGKQYLKDIYLVRDEAIVYQDTDVILGIQYLVQTAVSLGRPLVICVGLGSNQGGHDGTSIAEEYLATIGNMAGMVTIVCAGNEANLGHHYDGTYEQGSPYVDVEITVAADEKGFAVQLWAKTPDIYSIGILSPTGESISRLPARIGKKEEIDLLLERTTVVVLYELYEDKTGDELVIIRFKEPSEGLWIIRVYGDVVVVGEFNLWLPREGWNSPATQFLRPNPFNTVTIPSTNELPITIGAYNHLTNSIYIPSGRGLTRDGEIKPDLVAPGVNVEGPLPNNSYGVMSGTSVAAALTAGASALLLEWGIIQGNSPGMDTRIVRKILIRGATRKEQLTYPNRLWGFGTLNLFNSFEIIRGRTTN